MNWLNRLFKNQKGVFLVFTAVLLPIIFACAGLAMDLGSAFAHKSKLQNAADAAALAGAKTFAVNNETVDKHPLADAMAVGYANTNYQKEIIETHRKLQSQTKDGKTYYRVYLKDYVPVTFMRLLGVGPTMEVSVDAIATVPQEGDGKLFNIGSNIYGSFYNGNNDYGNTVRGATFDGSVVIYDKGKYEQYKNDSNYYFYKSEAAGVVVKNAIEQKLYTTPVLGENYSADKNKIDEEIKALFNTNVAEVEFRDTQFDIPGNGTLHNYYKIVPDRQKLNVVINIQQDLISYGAAEDKDKPIYIYVEDPPGLALQDFQLVTHGNETRPIIFYYSGKSKLTFEGKNSKIFRGVLCVPNAKLGPFNFGNSEFFGSVWANEFELNDTSSRYKFEGFGNGVFGGHSSGGGEDVKLKLVDGSGLTWN